jgi:hypothetical protein
MPTEDGVRAEVGTAQARLRFLVGGSLVAACVRACVLLSSPLSDLSAASEAHRHTMAAHWPGSHELVPHGRAPTS